MATRRAGWLVVGGIACAAASGALAWQLMPAAVRPVATPASNVAQAAQAAQQAHARAACGSLGPGTGLRDGKGWVVSMLPGLHRFRLRGGHVYLTTARQVDALDFDVGRPYYIALEGGAPDAVLEWQAPGRGWEPVGATFLYPPAS